MGFVDEPWRNKQGFLDSEVSVEYTYTPSEETRSNIQEILDAYEMPSQSASVARLRAIRGEKVRRIIETETDAQTASQKLLEVNTEGDPKFADAGLVAEDYAELFNKPNSLFQKRLMILNREFTDKVVEPDGFWSTAGVIFDSALSSSLNTFYDAAAKLFNLETRGSGLTLKEDGEKLYNMLSDPRVSDEEFRQAASEMIQKWNDAGLTTEANIILASMFMDSAVTKGTSKDVTLEQIFSVADLLIGVGGAPGAIAKYGNTIGRAKNAARAIANNSPQAAGASAVSPGATLKAQPGVGGMSTTLSNRKAILDQVKQFGILNDLSEINVSQAEIAADISKRLEFEPSRISDIDVSRNVTNIPEATITIGKRGGDAWAYKASAEKFAKKVNGTVTEVNQKGKKRYLVTIKDKIKTETPVETDITKLFDGNEFLANITSTRFVTEARLDNILKTGESRAAGAVENLMNSYKKILVSTPSDSRKKVDAIIKLFRDEPAYSKFTVVNTQMFKDRFLSVYGRHPDKSEVELFETSKALMDAEWFIEADRLMRMAIQNNEVMVKIGNKFIRAKRIKEKGKKLNLSTGKFEDVEDGFMLMEPMKTRGNKSVRYVTGTTERTLNYGDLVPYNFGGHRYYKTPTRFFVKAGDDAALRTFMGVSTEAEAKKAVEQIRNILNDLRDETVRANNDWNPDLETVQDFENFFKQYEIDNLKDIDYFSDGETDLRFGFKEHFVTPWLRGRTPRPLAAYGGGMLEVENPLATIDRSLTATINRRAEAKYMYQAVAGWLKAAEASNMITNLDELKNLTPLAKMKLAVLPKGKKVAQALENERNVILRRLAQSSEENTYFSRLMESAAEFAFKADAKKVKKLLDWGSNNEPLSFMRWLAFNTKLGMWNIRQIWLQSSHLLNSAAIASSNIGTVGAMRTMAATPILRAALVKGIPQKAKEMLAVAQSRVSGITKDEFLELVEWVEKNGRNAVSRTYIEDNLATGPAVPIAASRLVDAGQVFFREGELLARLGSVLLSFAERKTLGGKVNLFDEGVTEALMGRQDELIASMTRASSANWQKDVVGSTVLQFASYNLRMWEQVYSSKVLTVDERLRLLFAQALFWGVAGFVPLRMVDDNIEEYFGNNETASTIYNFVRRGVIDKLFESIVGAETDFASSVAPLSGQIDFLANLIEQPIGAGPSIFLDSAGPIVSFAKNVVKGDTDYAKDDLESAARVVSSFNNIHKMIFALKTGEYRSQKTGALIVDDINVTEAILLAMGVPLAKINDVYNMTITAQNLRSYERTVQNKVAKIMSSAAEDLENGDMESYDRKLRDAGMLLNTVPLIRRRQILQDVMRSRANSLEQTLIRRFIMEGRNEIAERNMNDVE